MRMPSSEAVWPNIESMNDSEVRELAVAYLDLLRSMVEALEACETGYGFFDWSGQGFNITGHPPTALIERLKG